MKKKIKPTSVKLDEELSEELGQRCNELGCSKSDFIKNSVEYTLTGSSEFDFDGEDEETNQGQDTKDTNPEPEPKPKPIKVTVVPEPAEMTNVTVVPEERVEATNVRVVQEQKPIEKSEPEIIIETKTVVEDFIPSYQCADGNCGIHENPNYKKIPKGQCNNCNQFTKHDKGTCPWCNQEDSIDEVDNDYLEDLGIRFPNTEILDI